MENCLHLVGWSGAWISAWVIGNEKKGAWRSHPLAPYINGNVWGAWPLNEEPGSVVVPSSEVLHSRFLFLKQTTNP